MEELTVEAARTELANLRRMREASGFCLYAGAALLLGVLGALSATHARSPTLAWIFVAVLFWLVIVLAANRKNVRLAPDPRYDRHIERIRFLEGFLAARGDKLDE
jgi:uncharacterized membrane protein YfcA